jgi:glycosyltransferase involved in cell wall biosynthesis
MNINYISDNANWVLNEIGMSLRKHISEQRLILKNSSPAFMLSQWANRFRPHIYHFSSIYNLPQVLRFFNPRHHYIFTHFHVTPEHVSLVKLFARHQHKFPCIHTSCELTRKSLVQHGVQDHKIIIIPIGINVSDFSFTAPDPEIKRKLGLPLNLPIIGSFQKDGNGWGEGLDPKLIKGPDMFCETVARLNQKSPIHVLLTGPARGYVKKELVRRGVPFTHLQENSYSNIPTWFTALDLYLVTSRIEGGPRAPMECMACGVPCISTRVGQVPELLRDGENGMLVDVDDVDTMVSRASELLENKSLQKRLTAQGKTDVKRYDYSVLAQQYWDKIYSPIYRNAH